ncbi:HEAT repeat domain-containing protein [Winogradskya humida]
MSAQALLSALSGLGDAAAVPCIADVLAAAVRLEQNDVARAALKTLTAFGLAAAPALATIRLLTGSGDSQVRAAAVVALQSAGGPAETLARELLAGDLWFQLTAAADVLGAIGTPAAAALPRLRELLTHSYDWVRLHCAAALWDIDRSPVVLDVLLQAWEKNPAATPFVVGCLGRMGDAAGPALPMLRAELGRPRRDDFASIHADEELLRVIREIV